MRHRYWRKGSLDPAGYVLWREDLKQLQLGSQALSTRVVGSGLMLLGVSASKEESWALWLAAWRMGGGVILCLDGSVNLPEMFFELRGCYKVPWEILGRSHQLPSTKVEGLCLYSTAIRHTFAGGPFWPHRTTHRGQLIGAP